MAACVQDACLCRRLRHHVLPTYYRLKSWHHCLLSFRTTVLPCLYRHPCTVSKVSWWWGCCLKKNIQNSLLGTFQNWMYVSHEKELAPWIFLRWHASSPCLPPGKSEDFWNMTLKLFFFIHNKQIRLLLYQFPFVCSFEVDFPIFFGPIEPRKLVLWRE